MKAPLRIRLKSFFKYAIVCRFFVHRMILREVKMKNIGAVVCMRCGMSINNPVLE